MNQERKKERKKRKKEKKRKRKQEERALAFEMVSRVNEADIFFLAGFHPSLSLFLFFFSSSFSPAHSLLIVLCTFSFLPLSSISSAPFHCPNWPISQPYHLREVLHHPTALPPIFPFPISPFKSLHRQFNAWNFPLAFVPHFVFSCFLNRLVGQLVCQRRWSSPISDTAPQRTPINPLFPRWFDSISGAQIAAHYEFVSKVGQNQQHWPNCSPTTRKCVCGREKCFFHGGNLTHCFCFPLVVCSFLVWPPKSLHVTHEKKLSKSAGPYIR